MDIDPPDAAAVDLTMFDETDYFRMRNSSSLKHPLIFRQQFPAPTTVANQKLAVDQIVPGNFIAIK